MNLIKRLNQSTRSRGFWGTLRWIYNGFFVVKKFTVYYLSLNKVIIPKSFNSQIRLQKISKEELHVIREKEKDLSVEFYCDITHNFSTPFVALIGKKIAAINWLVFPGQFSRFLNLEEYDAELNYNTVLPQFRGRRLAEKLMSFIIVDCQKKHLKRMFCVVSVDNVPQFKQLINLGFVPIETLTHFAFHRPKATLKYAK